MHSVADIEAFTATQIFKAINLLPTLVVIYLCFFFHNFILFSYIIWMDAAKIIAMFFFIDGKVMAFDSFYDLRVGGQVSIFIKKLSVGKVYILYEFLFGYCGSR